MPALQSPKLGFDCSGPAYESATRVCCGVGPPLFFHFDLRLTGIPWGSAEAGKFGVPKPGPMCFSGCLSHFHPTFLRMMDIMEDASQKVQAILPKMQVNSSYLTHQAIYRPATILCNFELIVNNPKVFLGSLDTKRLLLETPNPMPSSDSGSTTSSDGEFREQRIPCKRVASPRHLSDLLKKSYGNGNYKVEMRHNFYSIKSPATERQIDMVRLPTPNLE